MLPDLKTAPIKGKNVLLRIDTDVSIESRWTDGNTGQITDDSRLKASIRTIKFLLESGAAKVYVIGHRGRPKGLDLTYSLWPVANRLAELLGFKREFSKPQQIYEIDKKMVVFENLRFNPGEEDNSPEFAQELAQGRDIFIQDAFASCHRAHASTVGVLKHLQSYVGFSVLREVENLSRLLGATDLTIIIGGKKAKDKLSVIKHLFPRVESVLVGGVVANTFLKRQGHELGRSLIEEETFSQADEILAIN
ncbi:MAG TPA: phosphoglycerate kinase, partial [Patescibacteria group bacterium]|nr:phosphoglycerate kinase [Patescibacteria group bacterium]